MHLWAIFWKEMTDPYFGSVKCSNFGHLMQRANSLEKTLMLGKLEGKSGKR